MKNKGKKAKILGIKKDKNMLKKKSLNKNSKIIISIAIILLIIIYQNYGFAQSSPRLIKKIQKAFEKIQSYILIVATPIAGVAISTGLIMRKFSFGDEEKIRTSKKLIRGTIYSYAFILSTKFVLEFIQTLLK